MSLTRKHATILVIHKTKNILAEVRPDMLEMDDHPWIVLEDQETPIDVQRETLEKAAEVKKAEATIESNTKPTVIREKPKVFDIITKADGTPFKTEQSARAAMAKKGLSDAEYVVIRQAEEEYIIKQV